MFKVYSKSAFEEHFFNVKNCGVYSFLNPFSILKHEDYGTDIVFGVDSLYLARLFLCIENISFDNTSFAPKFFDYCVYNKKVVLFIGATEVENMSFIENIRNKYRNLVCCGIDGYRDWKDYITNITEVNYDFVVIGMGAPLQENLACLLYEHSPSTRFITCGGYIRQASVHLDYFPKVFSFFGLRFLYRFLNERHVFKRTLNSYLVFYFNFYGRFRFIRIRK